MSITYEILYSDSNPSDVLEPGTLVLMKDGTKKKVENIVEGDLVMGDGDPQSRKVTDLIKWDDPKPLPEDAPLAAKLILGLIKSGKIKNGMSVDDLQKTLEREEERIAINFSKFRKQAGWNTSRKQ